MAAVSLVFAAQNYSRVHCPPHIVFLLACLAFAGASASWAFNPELSFIRFAQQAMIVSSIILPAMLAARNVDMMRGLFLCFAFAALLNMFFVLGRPPIDTKFATWGYPGYFSGKNYLGQFAAVALLLSLHEMLYSGKRRAMGIVVAVIATGLLVLSNSKTSLGFAVLVPILALLTLTIARRTRVSPAIILFAIPVCYVVFSFVSGFSMNRLSYMLYGDPTFTGRTIIWDFAHTEIARRPLLGWGYQSFWLAGPDAPSIVNAPGWVKNMPNAHNGYLDSTLEMGYVGFALLIIFVGATLHAIGRVAAQDFARAWLLLSLALFVILYNFLESLWMRGFEFLWVLFLIVVAEAARHWQPIPRTRAAPGPMPPKRTIARVRPSRTMPGPQRPVGQSARNSGADRPALSLNEFTKNESVRPAESQQWEQVPRA
jgi:O-antigen ligase